VKTTDYLFDAGQVCERIAAPRRRSVGRADHVEDRWWEDQIERARLCQ
jgi:hypothetical protein